MNNTLTIRVSQPSVMATIREFLSTLKGVTIEPPAQEIAEPIEIDWEKAHRLAEANTKRNEDGHTVISRDDDWFYEDEWEEDYKDIIERYLKKKTTA